MFGFKKVKHNSVMNQWKFILIFTIQLFTIAGFS